ncbi:2-polyprenyl-6-methoxyphenol hydroxylase-like FAD-dependent oxidoreductase [Paenibacillus endophyticus]|uniref:2-polyprenyl-6-methoxyphenol hydroxylase-like FAD-dependent oxidoreductase n=1 Tax=Paenibacillus endophyticus TaxID=1294268 RepID=A0A7W5GD70_9BACL|nr:NAD(P)/FAD-dependent oxidoreductase [Paenibacillus endophyticus]MBB3154722.1 2-polyprenyl-6-methoxyphenol hydroxylase-like FAD-dependent oxidoreductase [Paenibacillus endophyticus]
MRTDYDVIIVGARIAGATLAYELGRAGYDVLLVDKGSFPSDVLSTHNFFNNSLAMLREMGVLDKLLSTGTPTYKRAYVQLEDAVIEGEFPEVDGESECLCIRRTHLDHILFEHVCSLERVHALQHFRVTGLVREEDIVKGVEGSQSGGETVKYTAKLVVGADGRRSTIRSLAGSKCLTAIPTEFASYVGYFKGFEQEDEPRSEFYKRGELIAIVFPTSDHLHVVGLMFPLANADLMSRMRLNAETGFREIIQSGLGESSFVSRLQEAEAVGPIRGLLGYDNDWHEAMGKGWALIGDAHSFKDPAIGQGMHDAMYSARLLKGVLDNHGLANVQWEKMASQYESELTNKFEPLFQLACEMTRNVPYTPEQQAVNHLIATYPQAACAFLGMYNHANDPGELGRLLGEISSNRESMTRLM